MGIRRTVSAIVVALAALAVPAATPEEAGRIVEEAKAKALAIPDQVNALVTLAWFTPERDAEVAARARKELGDFGQWSLPTLCNVIDRVSPEYVAEVVRTLMAARSNVREYPDGYAAALVEVLWIGNRETKRLVIPEIARFRYRAAILPMMDSALDDRELVPDVVVALGVIGDDRARVFLDKILNGDRPELREPAAASLARIGGRALEPLRAALRSPVRDLRLVAARALVPAAKEDDLSALYEYVTAHPDDDPATILAAKEQAQKIEKALAERAAADAASTPAKDF